MDNQNKDGVVTPEEAKLEQAAMVEAKAEEIRASIITEFGFNEVDDADRIDKLVNKEIDNRKKLSSAIGQKIKHRTEAEELRKKVVTPQSQDNTKYNPEEVSKIVDGKLSEVLERRDLDAMEYPDDIKKEIQRVAKITGVSVKQAVRDPYIVSKFLEPYEKEHKASEASISRTNRSGGKQITSFDNPIDPDMSTPEGRAEWEKWKKEQIKQGK